ncbi:MAG: aldo/keto reductase [Clostridia bacterium]|nr:aldo/keto reductase [Clostridia bacterium]
MSVLFRNPDESPAYLGFGMMRLPKLADGSIDQAEVNRMVDLYMSTPGPHHFDTAFMYDGGQSEAAFKAAVADRYPRASYTLTTKLVAWMACRDEASAKAEFQTSLERTGAGYFDAYLMHAVRLDNYQTYDAYHLWDYMEALKASGKIRQYGMSYHATPELLDRLLTTHPGIGSVQLQINYADWNSPEVRAKENYETSLKHGVPITVMSPARGGALALPPESIRAILDTSDTKIPYMQWALRFAASLQGVACVLTGASSAKELQENLALAQEPRCLSKADQDTLVRAIQAFADLPHVPCDMCHRCDASCPQHIAIPEIFSALNEVLLFGAQESAKGLYKRVTEGKGKGKAHLCTSCGACLPACPLRIPIPEYLKSASESFDLPSA